MAIMDIGAAILLAVHISSSGPSGGESCCTEPEVEAAAVERTISEADWRAFRAVAAVRQREGLEVLPGLVGCPSIVGAAAELLEHSRSRAVLARHRLLAQDYVRIGWALVVAYDPQSFGIQPSAAVTANRAFIETHQEQVRRLMAAD